MPTANQARKTAPSPFQLVAGHPVLDFVAGYARAMTLAAEKLAARSRTAYVQLSIIAELYANAGKTDEALAWLEKAYDARDPVMPMINVVPTFTSLRSEPRFHELLRRMNLPQN
jgi:hypothetical protein